MSSAAAPSEKVEEKVAEPKVEVEDVQKPSTQVAEPASLPSKAFECVCCPCCCCAAKDLAKCCFPVGVSSVALLITLIGSGLALSERYDVMHILALFHVHGKGVTAAEESAGISFDDLGTQAGMALGLLWPMYFTTIMVNLLVLVSSFFEPGKPFLGDTPVGCCCKTLFGPSGLLTMFFIVFFTFLINFILMLALIPIIPIFAIIMGACSAGDPAIHWLAGALDITGMVNHDDAILISHFCKIEENFFMGLVILLVGSLISVIGQALCIGGAVNNYVRISLLVCELDDQPGEEKKLASEGQQSYGATA